MVGANVGFAQNWLLVLSTPLVIFVQQMSAKVGSVTKTDLAGAIRIHYGKSVAMMPWYGGLRWTGTHAPYRVCMTPRALGSGDTAGGKSSPRAATNISRIGVGGFA